MDVEFTPSNAEPAVEAADSAPISPATDPVPQAEPIAAEAQQDEKAQAEDDETAEPRHDSLRDALAEAKNEVQSAREHASLIQAELDALKRNMRASEFSEYAKELVRNGRLPQTKQARLTEFMTALDGAGTYEFSEGSEPVVDRFKSLLADLLPAVDFSEAVTSEKAQVSNPRETAERIRAYRDELKAHGGSANISQVMQHIGG